MQFHLTMLHYLIHAIPYCSLLYNTILYYTVLYRTMQSYAILYYATIL